MAENFTLQCDDPDLALEKNALLIRECADSKEQIDKFNLSLIDLSEGKIGVVNEQLVVKLVEIGGAGLKEMLDAAIDFIGTVPMMAAFDGYISLIGEAHESDPRSF